MSMVSTVITTGGPRNSKPGTLNHLFFDAIEQYRKPDAMQIKRNGRYEPISHDTIAQRVRRTALGLEALGVRPGDRIAILSENWPEWAIADYACLNIGVADVPIYPNLPSDQISYILRDAGAVAIFVSNAEQAAKITPIRRVHGPNDTNLRCILNAVAVVWYATTDRRRPKWRDDRIARPMTSTDRIGSIQSSSGMNHRRSYSYRCVFAKRLHYNDL
jgi:long-subunit acyl-CoA synthetase (AMP-forming)